MSQSWGGAFHSAAPFLLSMTVHNINRLSGLKDRRNNKEPARQRRWRSQPLWDILSQRAGFGEAPQQAFLRATAQQKFRSVATPELLAICALPNNRQNNGGHVIRLCYMVSGFVSDKSFQ